MFLVGIDWYNCDEKMTLTHIKRRLSSNEDYHQNTEIIIGLR
jgi:hypothetical protein